MKSLALQREVLLQRLAEVESTNHDMRSQLEEKEALAVHSQVSVSCRHVSCSVLMKVYIAGPQTLHSEIGQKNAEIESMAIRIQVRRRDPAHQWVCGHVLIIYMQSRPSLHMPPTHTHTHTVA